MMTGTNMSLPAAIPPNDMNTPPPPVILPIGMNMNTDERKEEKNDEPFVKRRLTKISDVSLNYNHLLELHI